MLQFYSLWDRNCNNYFFIHFMSTQHSNLFSQFHIGWLLVFIRWSGMGCFLGIWYTSSEMTKLFLFQTFYFFLCNPLCEHSDFYIMQVHKIETFCNFVMGYSWSEIRILILSPASNNDKFETDFLLSAPLWE